MILPRSLERDAVLRRELCFGRNVSLCPRKITYENSKRPKMACASSCAGLCCDVFSENKFENDRPEPNRNRQGRDKPPAVREGSRGGFAPRFRTFDVDRLHLDVPLIDHWRGNLSCLWVCFWYLPRVNYSLACNEIVAMSWQFYIFGSVFWSKVTLRRGIIRDCCVRI